MEGLNIACRPRTRHRPAANERRQDVALRSRRAFAALCRNSPPPDDAPHNSPPSRVLLPFDKGAKTFRFLRLLGQEQRVRRELNQYRRDHPTTPATRADVEAIDIHDTMFIQAQSFHSTIDAAKNHARHQYEAMIRDNLRVLQDQLDKIHYPIIDVRQVSGIEYVDVTPPRWKQGVEFFIKEPARCRSGQQDNVSLQGVNFRLRCNESIALGVNVCPTCHQMCKLNPWHLIGECSIKTSEGISVSHAIILQLEQVVDSLESSRHVKYADSAFRGEAELCNAFLEICRARQQDIGTVTTDQQTTTWHAKKHDEYKIWVSLRVIAFHVPDDPFSTIQRIRDEANNVVVRISRIKLDARTTEEENELDEAKRTRKETDATLALTRASFTEIHRIVKGAIDTTLLTLRNRSAAQRFLSWNDHVFGDNFSFSFSRERVGACRSAECVGTRQHVLSANKPPAASCGGPHERRS